jgi:hypothetical protein
MARRYYRRSYSRARSIGHQRALQHIEEARQLTIELGGTDQDVKQYFFGLSPAQLRSVLDEYGRKHGADARKYAEETFDEWRAGQVQMGGQTASRLFSLLPPRMPLPIKYRLIENLWNHVGPKSKKTLRIGLDANIEQVLKAIHSHIEDVVIHYRIPENLERRFDWLAAGDAHVKQDLLNYLRSKEKALVVEGAGIRLPVLLEHLRSEAGRLTHRVADVLKIGNHELELLLDNNASGVAVAESYTPSVISRAASTAIGQGTNFKWLWWAIAAAVALYFFAGPKTSKPSYQPSTHTIYQPSTPATGPVQTERRLPTTPQAQPSTPATAPVQTERRLPTTPQAQPSVPPLAKQLDTTSDHGPGRVSCDVQWSYSHRDPSGYQDFIRTCMSRGAE